jgi:Tfp pilus assembly protein PilF
MEQNLLTQAIEAYQTALSLKPNDTDILNNLQIALTAQANPLRFF